jgi:hypothetical protein
VEVVDVVPVAGVVVVVVLLLPMPMTLRKRRKRDGCVTEPVAGFTFVTTTLPSALVVTTMLPVADDVVDDVPFAIVAAFFARACSTIARA